MVQKAAIVASWNSVASRWEEWAPIVDAWFRPATIVMLRALDLTPGESVLELAAGSGGFTRYLAEAVGAKGRVVATDSGPAMVRLLGENARRARWTQVEPRVMDGEAPDVGTGAFDAVACRQAFMFFADPTGALERLRATLRPKGRLVVSVFSTAERNAVIAMPMEVLARFTGPAHGAPSRRGGPGPFALGDAGELERRFRTVGYSEVRVERVPCPLRMPSAAEMVRFFREIVLGKLDELPAGQLEEAVHEMLERAAPFADPSGGGGPCEILVGSGRRPP